MQKWQLRVYQLKVDVAKMVGNVVVSDIAVLASGHEYQYIGFEDIDLFLDNVKILDFEFVDVIGSQAAAFSRAVGIADPDLADVVPQIFDLFTGYDGLQLRDKSFRTALVEAALFSVAKVKVGIVNLLDRLNFGKDIC